MPRDASPSRQYGGSGRASHPSVVSDGSPVEPQRQHHMPVAPEAAPETAPEAAPEAAPEPQEDPVALQERIMKEKRLEARQRRLEQEEKEKAAKDERIRQKLLAMGPAPDKNKRKDNEGRKTTAPTSPSIIHSPPKPPVPEPTGPKQYGLMKVHHPDSVKKLVAGNERDRVIEKPIEKTSPHLRRAPSPHREVKRDATPHTNVPPPPPASHQPQDPKLDEHSSHWRGHLNVSNSYSPWSTNSNLAPTPPSVKNPWKPLSSDRTLGNGIFDQSLGGFPSRELPLRSQLGLDQSTMSAPPYSGPQESASVPNLPSPENRPAPQDALSPISRPGRIGGRPRPIGPPSSQPQDDANREVLSAWNNFHLVAREREAEQAERFTQEFKARQNIAHAQPIAPVALKHTWKQVQVSAQSCERRFVKSVPIEFTGNATKDDSTPKPSTGLDTPADGLPFTESTARPTAGVPARSSRFFPHGTEQPKQSTADNDDFPRSPSPPPPDEISSYRGFSNGSGRPLVHLPAPKPVVKLPPKPSAVVVPVVPVTPTVPPTFASMAAAPPRVTPNPATTAISWQDKINALCKKTTPEKKSSLAVASATKEPLDVQLPAAVVSVSLPTTEQGVQIGDGDLAVRQVEEAEEIFEDREPGSQPGVRVPNMAPPAAWLPTAAPSTTRVQAKILKSVDIRTVDPFWVGNERDASGNTLVILRLPGAPVAKPFTLPKKADTPSPPRQQSSSNASKPRRGYNKPRETTGSNNATKKPASHKSNAPSSSPRRQSRHVPWPRF